jgi:phosphatidylglycerophosphatase GEP4
MVSNSAGSAKDRGGIGAEALSMSLHVPVLAHRQPKPACAPDIVAYFAGRLGAPKLTRDRVPALAHAEVEEEAAEAELLAKWRWSVEEGPLAGRLLQGTLEERMVAAQYRVPPPGTEWDAGIDAAMETKSRAEMQREVKDEREELPETEGEALRVLVVGDRQFTDVLLARRLELYGVAATAVLTTALPQPADVRPLRRLEAYLAPGDTAQARSLASFVRIDPPPPPSSQPAGLARLNPAVQARAAWAAWTADTPAVQLDPRSGTWRPKPLFVAAVRGLGAGMRVLGRYVRAGGAWAWVHVRRGAGRGWAATKAKAGEMRAEYTARREAAREAKLAEATANADAAAMARAEVNAVAEAKVAAKAALDGDKGRIQPAQ